MSINKIRNVIVILFIPIVTLILVYTYIYKDNTNKVIFSGTYSDNIWKDITEQIVQITSTEIENLYIDNTFIFKTDGVNLNSLTINIYDSNNSKLYSFCYNRNNSKYTKINYIDIDKVYGDETLVELEYIFNLLDKYDINTLTYGLSGGKYALSLNITNFGLSFENSTDKLIFKYLNSNGIYEFSEKVSFSEKNIAIIVSDDNNTNYFILDELSK